MTHTNCGGRLHPEEHDNWVYSQGKNHDPILNGKTLLYRCDRCHKVGVLHEPVPKVLALPSDT